MERVVKAKLRLLRRRFYPDITNFTKATRIFTGNVKKVEEMRGHAMPSVKNLHRWVIACGMSMSGFYAEIERDRGQVVDEHPIVEAVRVLACRDAALADDLLQIVNRLNLKASRPASENKSHSGSL